MDDIVFNKLISFISEIQGIPTNRFHYNSRLVDDLNIYGDDAYELLSAYVHEFNVDASNFNFDHYFPSEGSLFWICKIFNFLPNLKITISHLMDGIIAGKLDDLMIVNKQ